jgi:hypothetical protein
VPVTFTVRKHKPGLTVPPVRLTVGVPGAAVAVPPQAFPNPLDAAITRPGGKMSLKATPVSDVATFGLEMVIVSVAVLPADILPGLNPMLMDGG